MTGRWLTALGVDRRDTAVDRRVREGERLRAAGRVMSVRTVAGHIEGRVQGSHARPHRVELSAPVWSDDVWRAVGDLLSQQARHYARVLAGQLPDQFDLALTELGVSLLPDADEWQLRCTCSQPQPCAHQLAVWLATRDRLSDDPYLIARLRGRSRAQLLAEIRDRRTIDTAGTVAAGSLDRSRWSAASIDPYEVPLPEPRRVSTVAGPLQMLGTPSGWSGPVDPVTMFGPTIAAAADTASALLYGDDEDGTAD